MAHLIECGIIISTHHNMAWLMNEHDRSSMRKFVSPEIIFGEGALDLIGRYVTNLSGQRIFIVSDKGVGSAGWTGRVEHSIQDAGLEHVLFDAVSANPRTSEVMKGAELYEREKCDVIVAVGGGSPMDCAKAVGVVATNGRNVLEFEGVDAVEVPGPPLICIPTTAGSSADVSQFAIITDEVRKKKMAIISKAMVPDISIIDPATTATMGLDLTADTGMDALCHAFEAYVSNASSMMTDLFALEAVRLISEHLPLAYEQPDSMLHRENMMRGSMYAGLAFSNASLGLVHAMAHSAGGMYDAPHGECNAALLEHVVQFNYPSASGRYDMLESVMRGTIPKDRGLDPEERLVGKLRDLRKRLGILHGLTYSNVLRADLVKLGENALQDPCIATNPRPVTLSEVMGIYERAL